MKNDTRTDKPPLFSTHNDDHDDRLLQAHMRLQHLIIRFVPLPTAAIFAALVIWKPVWQFVALLTGVLLMLAFWLLAHRVTRKKQLEQSVLLFCFGAIGMEAVVMSVIDAPLPSAIMGCMCAIIYASLFSRRHLFSCVALSLIAYMGAQFLDRLLGYEKLALEGIVLHLFDGAFMVLLLSVAAYLLWWSFNLKDGLFLDVKASRDNYTKVLAAARDTSESIASVMSHLERFAAEISAQAAEQAAAVSETGTSVIGISQMAKETADISTALTQAGSETRQKSSVTLKRLKDVRTQFNQIIGVNEDTRAVFSELSSHAENIDDVLRLNRDIAAQIKILAVNAGIQAAKAGDKGSGFKVVAQELKQMIVHTEKTLEDSALLLESIRERALSSASMVEIGSRMLEEHYEELNAMGALVEDISNVFGQAHAQFGSIAASSQRQLSGIVEINAGIDEIDLAAQHLRDGAATLLEHTQQLTESRQQLNAILDS